MNKKNLGQVFTPERFVDLTLDKLGYSGVEMLNKKILEPSFGDGAFLIKIIERLITFCLELNYSNAEIETQLTYIYGIEIDEDLFKITQSKIKGLLLSYGLDCYEKINLYCMDAISFNDREEFDFVVGNPPYVRVHNIETSIKNKIRTFEFCKGQIDLYIAFFEMGLSLLNQNGKLAYITPNSYFKNSSQREFRNYLVKNNLLEKIIDFKSYQIFENAKTYTAISVLNKNKLTEEIEVEIFKKDNYKISVKELAHCKEWVFLSKDEREFISNILNQGNELSSIAHIQYGIVTNRDKIYIGAVEEVDDKYVYFNKYLLERDILKPAFKASKLSYSYILFPYLYSEELSKYIVMEEEYLKENYPLAYKYLLDHKLELSLRDMEENMKWYQFARSQGLGKMKNRKLTFKHIIKDDIESLDVVELEDEVVVFSGLYITAKDERDFDFIKEILRSESMLTYLRLVGKDMQNNYKLLTGNHLKEFNYYI